MTSFAKLSQLSRIPEPKIRALVDRIKTHDDLLQAAFDPQDPALGLSLIQLKRLLRQAKQCAELEHQKKSIINALTKVDKITDDIKAAIELANSRGELDDIMAPLKLRKPGKSSIARDCGLEPLAAIILKQEAKDSLESLAQAFIKPGSIFDNPDAVLGGVRAILIEYFGQMTEMRRLVRRSFEKSAVLSILPSKFWDAHKDKLKALESFSKPLDKISERDAILIRRGLAQRAVKTQIDTDDARIIAPLYKHVIKTDNANFKFFLESVVSEAYHLALRPVFEVELRQALNQYCEDARRSHLESKLREKFVPASLGSKAVVVFTIDADKRVRATLVAANGGLIRSGQIKLGQAEAAVPAPVEESAPPVVDSATAAESPVESQAAADSVESVAAIPQAKPNLEPQWSINDLLTFVRANSIGVLLISEDVCAANLRQSLNQALKATKTNLPQLVVNTQGADLFARSTQADALLPGVLPAVCAAVFIARKTQHPLQTWLIFPPLTLAIGSWPKADSQNDPDQVFLREVLQEIVCISKPDPREASQEVLSYLPGMTAELAAQWITWRTANPALTDIKQLLAIPGMTEEVLQKIRPCLGKGDAKRDLVLGGFQHTWNDASEFESDKVFQARVVKSVPFGVMLDVGLNREAVMAKDDYPLHFGKPHRLRAGDLVAVKLLKYKAESGRMELTAKDIPQPQLIPAASSASHGDAPQNLKSRRPDAGRPERSGSRDQPRSRDANRDAKFDRQPSRNQSRSDFEAYKKQASQKTGFGTLADQLKGMLVEKKS